MLVLVAYFRALMSVEIRSKKWRAHRGGLARPNVLMFGEWAWIDEPAEAQERERTGFLRSFDARFPSLVARSRSSFSTARCQGEDAKDGYALHECKLAVDNRRRRSCR
jgi:hypothetical protein